ncbi:T9SS type A sorting domain-containing protein [Aggregatimonas sangjinii]|uniref:T9SS type A sorting domain-containing protein n=1 Tax=Aggregatimonas sangjinii TaxID=2583587 RepID=A0A5B7SW99_9FLAO|nr:T9SS type A sorting domain-containing protein [Aggregatimonas sangjinii]QCX01599.1 T9SS type A sorting domain-containing protein [Aggregatimonas sangjinii]
MMKLLPTYVLLGICAITSAQAISKTVMASGGEALTNGEIHLNSTIGEPLIGMVENDLALDQGFWAGSLFVEPLTPKENLGGIIIFPNPVEEELNIFTNNTKVYGIALFSMEGRMVLQKKVDEFETEHLIDASILAKGAYVLQIFVVGEAEEKLFKVIKK